MSILQMVPVSFGHFTQAKTDSGVPRLTSHVLHPSHLILYPRTTGNTHTTQFNSSVVGNTLKALHKEIKVFKQREALLKLLKVLVLLQVLLGFVDFATIYWWSAFLSGFGAIVSVLLPPKFGYIGGSPGTMRRWDKWVMLLLSLMHFKLIAFNLGLFLYLLLVDVLQNSCYSAEPLTSFTIFRDPALALGCSGQTWLSLFLYPLQALVFLMASLVALSLRVNFNFQAGLFVEPTLAQTKAIPELLEISQHGRVRDRRQVAFELGSITLLGDSKKEEIVSAGGYQVLISLITDQDAVTQEYAIEALAEVLSLQSVQSEFVSQRGIAILCALLCSSNPFVMERAAVALSQLIAHCSSNRVATVQEDGVDAFVQALSQAPPAIVPIILQSLLGLARCPLSVPQLCANSTLVKTVVGVFGEDSYEREVKVKTVLILDEIGKYQPSLITSEVKLIGLLLESLRWSVREVQMILPALRLVMIFAKDTNRCKNLLETDFVNILESFQSTAEAFKLVHCPAGLDLQAVRLLEVLMQQEHLVAKLVYQGVRRYLEQTLKQSSDAEVTQAVFNCLQRLS